MDLLGASPRNSSSLLSVYSRQLISTWFSLEHIRDSNSNLFAAQYI